MRILSLSKLALRRLIHQRALAACLLVGITIAVALAAAIPNYVSAAQARVLRQRLQDLGVQNAANRDERGEPFALRFSYLGFGTRPITLAKYKELDDYVLNNAAGRTVLPNTGIVRYFSTDRFKIFPADETAQKYALPADAKPDPLNTFKAGEHLFYGNLDVLSDMAAHIRLDDGRMPQPTAAGEPIEALVYRAQSERFGLQAGDLLTVVLTTKVAVNTDNKTTTFRDEEHPVPMKIAGVWSAKNPREDYWLIRPSGFVESLVLNEEAFRTRIATQVPNAVNFALWSVLLDDSALTIERVDELLVQQQVFKRETATLLDGFDIESKMVDALRLYRTASQELTLLLIVFCLPIFVMVFYFITLVGGMVVRQQEGEIAVLRSRGASSSDVVFLYVLQGLMIGAAALLIGLPLSLVVATGMNNTRTFLDLGFSNLDALRQNAYATLKLSSTAIQLGVIVVVAALGLTLLPAVVAARRNILGYASDRARGLRKPFWQRAYLDFLLLIPCVYGYSQLQQRGSLVQIATQTTAGARIPVDDPFRDPLRFLLPILTVTALGLIVVRFLPRIMDGLARVVGALDVSRNLTTPLFLALRELARSSRDYVGPLVLLIFTLGIATYGASAADTLDRHLTDSTYFQIGADARLTEQGESNKPQINTFSGAPVAAPPVDDGTPEIFTFPPVEGHLTITGVQEVARAAFIPVAPRIPGASGVLTGTLMALDRKAYHSIGRPAFREDYAGESLGQLMNALASSRDALLVRSDFLDAFGVSVGDELPLVVGRGLDATLITYTVRGAFDYFPMLAMDATGANGQRARAFVANMNWTFEQLGKEMQYDVLLKLDPKANGVEVGRLARDREFDVLNAVDARSKISLEQQRPERQGLFGVLTAGFVFVTLLTVIGFAVYTLLSLRRRSVEIGVLRAIGLSSGQMTLYVILLLTLVVLIGATVGAGLGVLASRLFIPFLQVGGSMIESVPQFLVQVAWTEIGLIFGALLLALLLALGGSLLFLRRLKTFEAIKLGNLG